MLDLYQKHQPRPEMHFTAKSSSSIWNDLPQHPIYRSIEFHQAISQSGGHFEHVILQICHCNHNMLHRLSLNINKMTLLYTASFYDVNVVTFVDAFDELIDKITQLINLNYSLVLIIQFSICSVNYILIFRTIAKIQQIYCWDIFYLGHPVDIVEGHAGLVLKPILRFKQ